MQTFLNIRNDLINNYPEDASRLGCTSVSGPLFVVERNQNLALLSERSVENLLSLLTAHVQEQIPDHPDIRVSHFTQSFQGHYASLGLRGVHCYYLSGRVKQRYEMPLRYSLVSLADLKAEHSKVHEQFIHQIHQEALGLGLNFLKPMRSSVNENQSEQNRFERVSFGSTRVPTIEIFRDIVGVLKLECHQPKLFDNGISEYHANLNALTRLAVVSLGVFNGLRPFEIGRLTRSSFDFDSQHLTVKGKARGSKPTYRHLPLHPTVSELIRVVLDKMCKGHTSSRTLFKLYFQDARRRISLSTKNLDQILNTAAQAAGWNSGPIFYGLRHGFRTAMLTKGMDEDNINYLMGHQIFGQPAYSIYHENHYQNLKQQYLDAAGEMTRLYGFQ